MEVVELKHELLRQDLARFRCIEPKSEARMSASIQTHGQLTPVLAGWFERERVWVLVDGFKRYRATLAHRMERLRVQRIERSMPTLKAMLLSAGEDGRPCREFEEALLLQSLHREDGLEQQQIALLCGRHKSWVSRRIGLVERLSDELREQLRLGLVSLSSARELLRLPRGNQGEVLAAIRNHSLSSRQTQRLVDRFVQLAPARRRAFLERCSDAAEEVFDRHIDCGSFSAAMQGLEHASRQLAIRVSAQGIGALTPMQRDELHKGLLRVIEHCRRCDTVVRCGESSP